MVEQELSSKTFAGPSTYQVNVEGEVAESQIQLAEIISVTHHKVEGIKISTITAKIIDQSSLSGLISALVDQRISVISVMKL